MNDKTSDNTKKINKYGDIHALTSLELHPNIFKCTKCKKYNTIYITPLDI
jgi:hypothetical protein